MDSIAVDVNGKTIQLRTRYPAREFHDLSMQWAALWRSEGTFEDQTHTMQRFVVGWDFPGDPAELDAWGELDALTEYGAIRLAIHQHVNEMFKRSKNSAAPSTSP